MKLPASFRPLRKLKAPLVVRKVQGHSMLPALAPGDYIIGLRYGLPLRQDRIVIFEHDGKEKVKRINKLRKDALFLLGDNQDASTDSRTFGWINRSSVVATLIWPKDI